MGQDINKGMTGKMNDSLDKIIASAQSVKGLTEYLRLVKEVLIRFDTNPKLYTKEDYFKLILLILRGFKYLNEKEDKPEIEIVTQWEAVLADDKVPSEKLVKETIDVVNKRLRWLLLTQDQNKSFKDISFIRVLGGRALFQKTKKENPGALIFFKDTYDGTQIISAAGEDFILPANDVITDIQNQLNELKQQFNNLLITLAPIFNFLKDFDPEDFVRFRNIDTNSNINGAGLQITGSGTDKLIQAKNSLVTREENGAMSATDKVKLDSIDWVEL